jgi:hypothetical protein
MAAECRTEKADHGSQPKTSSPASYIRCGHGEAGVMNIMRVTVPIPKTREGNRVRGI